MPNSKLTHINISAPLRVSMAEKARKTQIGIFSVLSTSVPSISN